MKKGFASMTIIYTFLIVFIMALLSLLAIFSQKSRLVDSITIEAKEQILHYTEVTEGVSFSLVNYEYNGSYQTFITPVTGQYKLEVWGAQGGYRNNPANGGAGGYATGEVRLTRGTILYIYVGGFGNVGGTSGGYNGGGGRVQYPGGGGATDIRVFEAGTPSSEDLDWNSTIGLRSRIIVAGGGGSDGASRCKGGAGGGVSGSSANDLGSGSECFSTAGGVGANDTYGGSQGGNFGIGGTGLNENNGYGGAGGGGWFGGGGVLPDTSADDDKGGGGGSGYVYTSTSTTILGYNVSNAYQMQNSSLIAGDNTSGLMPNPQGGNYQVNVGHSGNGYARITYIPQ